MPETWLSLTGTMAQFTAEYSKVELQSVKEHLKPLYYEVVQKKL